MILLFYMNRECQIAEIAKEKKLSERTIYRYKAYYDKVMSEQKALAE